MYVLHLTSNRKIEIVKVQVYYEYIVPLTPQWGLIKMNMNKAM